jgi:hypothetical protein
MTGFKNYRPRTGREPRVLLLKKLRGVLFKAARGETAPLCSYLESEEVLQLPPDQLRDVLNEVSGLIARKVTRHGRGKTERQWRIELLLASCAAVGMAGAPRIIDAGCRTRRM